MRDVIADAKALQQEATHPRGAPYVGGIARGQRSGQQGRDQFLALDLREPGRGTGSALGAQALLALGLPRRMPAADAHGGDMQPAGDLGLGQALRKEPSRSASPRLALLAIQVRTTSVHTCRLPPA